MYECYILCVPKHFLRVRNVDVIIVRSVVCGGAVAQGPLPLYTSLKASSLVVERIEDLPCVGATARDSRALRPQGRPTDSDLMSQVGCIHVVMTSGNHINEIKN